VKIRGLNILKKTPKQAWGLNNPCNLFRCIGEKLVFGLGLVGPHIIWEIGVKKTLVERWIIPENGSGLLYKENIEQLGTVRRLPEGRKLCLLIKSAKITPNL